MLRISPLSLVALGMIALAVSAGSIGCTSGAGGPGSSGSGGRTGGSSSGVGGAGNVSPPPTGAGGSSGGGGTTSGTGGNATTTGAGGTTSGTGGNGTTTGAGGAGMTCTLPTVAQTCADTVPRNPLLINFARYLSTGTWGNSAMGDLTGGTSAFQGTGVTPLTRVVEGADPDARLHVTGTIPVNSYAGFVLWFGPCVNLSTFMDTTGTPATTGIAAVLGGNLGGSRLKFQVQTNVDYPVDTPNMKGACLFTNCDARYSQCLGPTALLTTIPATPALTAFPWSRFTDGLPTATTNGDGVVGLQFQWECPTFPSCSVDVSLGTIVLTTN
jgi:hypothetical protein